MKDIKLDLGDGTSQDQTPKTIFQSEKHRQLDCIYKQTSDTKSESKYDWA